MKILQIVSSAYRGTIEEQDDTILWMCHSMHNAGTGMSLLLKENAVNYAVPGQRVKGLAFGAWKQTQPPKIDDDIAAIITAGVDVYALDEDLVERGIEKGDILKGVKIVGRAELPSLMEAHAQVWNW